MSIIIDTPARASKIKQALEPRYIGYGEKDVEYPEFIHIYDENGARVQDEQGEWVFDETKGYYILGEQGERVTDEQGNYVMREFNSPYLEDEHGNIQWDEEDWPILAEDWRNHLIAGVATQLSTVTGIKWVSLQAKTKNVGRIWYSSNRVIVGRGNYLAPRSGPVVFDIDDLSRIYIIGNAGDGVTFNFGGDDSFERMMGEDGGAMLGEDGGNILGD